MHTNLLLQRRGKERRAIDPPNRLAMKIRAKRRCANSDNLTLTLIQNTVTGCFPIVRPIPSALCKIMNRAHIAFKDHTTGQMGDAARKSKCM